MEKVVARPMVVSKEGHHVVTDVRSCAWGGAGGGRENGDRHIGNSAHTNIGFI